MGKFLTFRKTLQSLMIITTICFALFTVQNALPAEAAKDTKTKTASPAETAKTAKNSKTTETIQTVEPAEAVEATNAAPSNSFDFRFENGETISVGARGEHVKVVQKLLINTGFYTGNLDGVFGPMTLAALNDFKQLHDLPADGIVDKNTYLTLERAETTPSRYSRTLVMKASAYTAYDPGNGKYTARGSLLRKGLVAVDPTVIPLGTRLYIVGYGYAIADDVGGAIKGNRIDLAFENRGEALNFGVRNVTVHILN